MPGIITSPPTTFSANSEAWPDNTRSVLIFWRTPNGGSTMTRTASKVGTLLGFFLWNSRMSELYPLFPNTCMAIHDRILTCKITRSQMISEYATKTAYQPAMWGGAVPDSASATRLASVLNQEWTTAIDRMLRHWSTPPTTDNYQWDDSFCESR